MTAAIDTFIDKIRHRSRFAAASANNPIWEAHLSVIEFALKEIDPRANDDPAMIDGCAGCPRHVLGLYGGIQPPVGQPVRPHRSRLRSSAL